jgi:predicted dinucleotide-binding enzyme
MGRATRQAILQAVAAYVACGLHLRWGLASPALSGILPAREPESRRVEVSNMKPKVGIIGDGNVGSALRRGLERAGYEVRAVGKDPAQVKATGAWGDVVILAVPYGAVSDAVATLGDGIRGKTVVDATNALTEDMQLASGCTTSGAEALQQKARHAKVVKAFNTQFAGTMDTGVVNGQPLTVFAAGDDAGARQQVMTMARDIGFDAVDAGPLQNARLLEPLGFFNIQLGYVLGLGTDIGLKLIRQSR